jgi:hypothetical protein
MFRHRRKYLRHLLTHRLPAALLLVAYLVALFGVPVPVSAGKDRRNPFPCQDHACGCRNADDCWRHCCCFSLEERLAWARSQGVEPPAYVHQAAAQGWCSVRLRDQAEGKAPHGCTHCSHCDESPAHETQSPKPCCAGNRAGRHATGHWGLSFCALRCQGLHSWWASTLSVVPPPLYVTWNLHPICTGWLADHDVTAPPHFPTPPHPPPPILIN